MVADELEYSLVVHPLVFESFSCRLCQSEAVEVVDQVQRRNRSLLLFPFHTLSNMDSDLSHLQWRAPEYLLSLATPQLSTSSQVLDYFSLSPFFDKHSNNNQLRMQIMFSRGGMDGLNEEEELK